MNRYLVVSFLSVLGASGCAAVDAARALDAPGAQSSATGSRRLTIDDVDSGEVVEHRLTEKSWLRLPWMAPLLRRDLVDAWHMIESAERVYDPEPVLFIVDRSGVLHTRWGDYRFRVGEVKTASGEYRVSLFPVGEIDGREEMHWSLPGAAGGRLIGLVDQRLADNGPLAKRQGYVSKRQ